MHRATLQGIQRLQKSQTRCKLRFCATQSQTWKCPHLGIRRQSRTRKFNHDRPHTLGSVIEIVEHCTRIQIRKHKHMKVTGRGLPSVSFVSNQVTNNPLSQCPWTLPRGFDLLPSPLLSSTIFPCGAKRSGICEENVLIIHRIE